MNRNVVLLVLDSVRKDYFDIYAPKLQSLSDISFDQCRAASSWSTPSHASFMTGELPSEHGIHAHNVDFSELDRQDTFLEDLPEYKALGASTNIFAGTAFGFDNIFDDFSSMSRHSRFPDGLDIDKFLRETDRASASRYLRFLKAVIEHENPLKSTLNGAFLKLNDVLQPLPVSRFGDFGTRSVSKKVLNHLNTDSEVSFVFANFMESHTPLQTNTAYNSSLYDVSSRWSSNDIDIFEINNAGGENKFKEYLDNFRQLYAAAIDYLDKQLFELIQEILSSTKRETTIIVTADHGENLGTESDRHLIGHVGTLTEGTLHVPLEVINPPNGYDNSVTALVSHLDLPELIVGLARGKVVDIRRDIVPAERIGLGISHDPENYEYWDRMIRCVELDGIKYQWDSQGGSHRYALDETRSSWQDHLEENIEVPETALAAFGEAIRKYKKEAISATSAEKQKVDSRTKDQLANLGYL